MNLFNLTGKWLDLYTKLVDKGADEYVIADTIESMDLNEDIQAKAENYAMVIKQTEYDEQNLATEIKRLQELKGRISKRKAMLKDNLEQALVATHNTKFNTEKFSFSFRKSKSVQIDKEADIPQEFLKVKFDADKTKLKEALQAGQVITVAKVLSSRLPSLAQLYIKS